IGSQLVNQGAYVLASANTADGTGEDVIEYQGGYRQLGHYRTHAVAHHHVHSASHIHAAALEINAAHGEAEQHDADYEPRGGFADGLLGRAAGIKCGRRQVAEDNRSSAPKADEGKRYRRGDHYL